MLSDFIGLQSNLDRICITETLDDLNVSLSIMQSHWEIIEKLFHQLKTISQRDKFELFTDISGNLKSISSNSAESLGQLKQHFEEHYADGSEVEIELKIRKNCIDGKISVYFLEKIADNLCSLELKNTIDSISKRLASHLLFEVFDTIVSFGSNRIQFIQAPANFPEDEFIGPDERVSLFKDNCMSADHASRLIPDDFYLKSRSDNTKINDLFDAICALMCIIFIASTSEIKNEKLSYKINGYKTVVAKDIDPFALLEMKPILFKIYSWAYDGGNCADKLGLIRNILSLHLDSAGDIKYDDEVWTAIKSNYQIYLHENIQSYLEVKNKITGFLLDISSKAYEYADGFLETFKNNVFILLGFLISVILLDGFKDEKLYEIFSPTNTYAVYFLALISVAWMVMSAMETHRRYNHAATAIESILSKNYKNLLMEAEISACVKPTIDSNKEYITEQIKRYSVWWLIMLFAFVLFFSFAPSLISKQESVAAKLTKEQFLGTLNGPEKSQTQQQKTSKNNLSHETTKTTPRLDESNKSIPSVDQDKTATLIKAN